MVKFSGLDGAFFEECIAKRKKDDNRQLKVFAKRGGILFVVGIIFLIILQILGAKNNNNPIYTLCLIIGCAAFVIFIRYFFGFISIYISQSIFKMKKKQMSKNYEVIVEDDLTFTVRKNNRYHASIKHIDSIEQNDRTCSLIIKGIIHTPNMKGKVYVISLALSNIYEFIDFIYLHQMQDNALQFHNPLLENLLRESKSQRSKFFLDIMKDSSLVIPFSIQEQNGFPYSFRNISLHVAFENGYLLTYSDASKISEDIKTKFPLCLLIPFKDILKQMDIHESYVFNSTSIKGIRLNASTDDILLSLANTHQ